MSFFRSSRALFRSLVAVSLLAGTATAIQQSEKNVHAATASIDDEWICTSGDISTYIFIIGQTYDCVRNATDAISWARNGGGDSSDRGTLDAIALLASKGITVAIETSPQHRVRLTGTVKDLIVNTSSSTAMGVSVVGMSPNPNPFSFNSGLGVPKGSLAVTPSDTISLTESMTLTATIDTTNTAAGYSWTYRWTMGGFALPGETGNTLTINGEAFPGSSRNIVVYATPSWTDGTKTVTGTQSNERLLASKFVSICSGQCPTQGQQSPSTTPTTTAAPTTTTPSTTTPSTTVPASTTTPVTTAPSIGSMKATAYLNAIPGVTMTDSVVYKKAPQKVATNSSIIVLTDQAAKRFDVVSRTPSVCVPTDTDLVFINKGRCVADIVNVRTQTVLRKLRTLVSTDNITLLQVGNATATMSPIYFQRMSATINSRGIAALQKAKQRATKSGTILIIGHSGTLSGNSLPNQQIANARALAAMSALKRIGAKGVFATSSIGALAPAATGKSEKAQRQNRRVVLALIP